MKLRTLNPKRTQSLVSFVNKGLLVIAVIVIWPSQSSAAGIMAQKRVSPKPIILIRMQPDEVADAGTQVTVIVASGSGSANKATLFAIMYSTHTYSRLIWRIAQKKEVASLNSGTAA